MSDNNMSKSKQKRLEIEKARKAQQKKKLLSTLCYILIPLAIIGLVVLAYFLYQQSKVDFSKHLSEEGIIEDINIEEYVTVNYQDMTFHESDLLPADETIDADLRTICEGYSFLSTDTSVVSKIGDRINISYTTYMDGVSLNQITPEQGGQDFIIGNSAIAEEFDNALIGHSAGDQFSIDITFPADYYDTTVAGATVTYDILVAGVYVVPEFDDAFVAEYLSGEAASAEEYRQNLIQQYYDENLRAAVTDSLSMNTVVLQYPEDYAENMERIYLSENQKQLQSYNSMYYEYLGYNMYNSVYEMFGYTSEEEYRQYIAATVADDVEYFMSVQYIYEMEGLTNTTEEVKNYYLSSGYDEITYQDTVNAYSYEYVAQMAMANRVLDYLMENATILP